MSTDGGNQVDDKKIQMTEKKVQQGYNEKTMQYHEPIKGKHQDQRFDRKHDHKHDHKHQKHQEKHHHHSNQIAGDHHHDHDHDHHHHDHDHDHHHHDHDHDHHHHEHQIKNDKEGEVEEDKVSSSSDDEKDTDPNKKTNRGQKKFHKAMTKLGMKPVTGINRVTVKKGKSFMFSIDDPEILKSPGADNTYVIFGKPNMEDINSRLGQSELKNLSEPVQPEQVVTEKPATEEATAATEESGEEVSDAGLSAENIKMVVEYTKCTRAAAIKTLRETNDDTVAAIMKLTG